MCVCVLSDHHYTLYRVIYLILPSYTITVHFGNIFKFIGQSKPAEVHFHFITIKTIFYHPGSFNLLHDSIEKISVKQAYHCNLPLVNNYLCTHAYSSLKLDEAERRVSVH